MIPGVINNINLTNFKFNLSILFSIIKYKKIRGKKNIIGSQTKTEKKENKTKEKFFSLWCNGTIVHWDSFLNGLVTGARDAEKSGEDYSWTVYTQKAIEDGKPIWPSRWPLEKLEERKQFYIDSGTPAKFYQEYMNQAKSPEDQVFGEEDINDGLCGTPYLV